MKNIKGAIIQLRKKWVDLWSSMASQNIKDYDALKATPGMEFWRLYEIYKSNVEKQNKA